MQRFIGRREYFGSVFYDLQRRDYIPFDKEATDIFILTKTNTLSEIYSKYEDLMDQIKFDTFIQLSKSIGILDQQGKFTGKFISEKPSNLKILSAPLKVYISLTKACNLNCKHCYLDAINEHPDDILTFKELKAILDNLVSIGTYEVSFTGGEPLLRKDLFKILQYATDLNMGITLSTNATLITPSVASKLANYNIKVINISVDGFNERSIDFIKGKGTYRKLLKGLRNIKKIDKQIKLIMKVVVSQLNKNEMPAFVRFAEKIKVPEIIFIPVLPLGRAKKSSNILLSNEESYKLMQLAKRLSLNTRVKIHTLSPPFKFGSKKLYSNFGDLCGNLMAYIDYNGEVYPSNFLKLKSGNIRQIDFSNIWKFGEGFLKIRSLKGNKDCLECRHYSMCRGGLRSRAYLFTGNLNAKDPICFVEDKKN